VADHHEIRETAYPTAFKADYEPAADFERAEAVRATMNNWILASGQHDAVTDFARAVADPAVPQRLNPALQLRGQPPPQGPPGTRRSQRSSTSTTCNYGNRKKIVKRLDPTRPHEQELRRDATTIGQALAEAGGLISKESKRETHHD
jgi:hypothetical protein